MFKFTICVVLCAALVYESTASNELGSSKDDVKKAFHKLMDAIDKALSKASAELDRAMAKVNAKAAELEGKATHELDKVLAPLRKKLDDLVEKAKAKGFDVSKCSNYVDDFSLIPDKMVHNLIDCITSPVNKAQHYVDDALKNAKKIEEDLNTIDAEIDNCGGNALKKAKCYAKLLQKIAHDSEKAPQHIIEDVTKVTALVSELIPVMEECLTHQVKKAGEDATKDVADFAVCVGLPF